MSSLGNKFKLPARLVSEEKDVRAEYAKLAIDYGPLDFGQDCPDYSPPNDIREILESVAKSEDILIHQYTRDYGHPRLVNVLSKLYSRLVGREIDPQAEILTTVGAYEALFSSIIGHVDAGDEVVIIEPFFYCYETVVRVAGGVPKFVPLRLGEYNGTIPTSRDWVLDKQELERAFSSKTKVIILNNPHSPVGKVFTLEELLFIADLCKKWNVLCISDEVYEWFVYNPNEHVRISSLGGMWERSITIGSAGKTFGATGWKLGWAYGPSNLLHNLEMVHQNSVYTGNTPIQEVVAISFEKELLRLDQASCYFNSISTELAEKRNYMAKILSDVGMMPTIPEAGYFMVTDWTPLESKIDLSSENDKWKGYRFTKWMTKNVGLQAIPLTTFYSQDGKALGENFVRYCFFKKNESLNQAAQILKNWK